MLHNTSKEIKLKVFVPESDKQCQQFTKKTFTKQCSSSKFHNVEPLTGEKAKQFYKNVLKTTEKKIHQKNCIKDSKAPKLLFQRFENKNSTFKNSDLFRLAQNDDINNLKIFFEENKDLDINIVDDFHWTALMCASCSGAERAVSFLLKNGADPNKSDKLGNTPLKLAKAKKFEKIVKLLENKNALNGSTTLPVIQHLESIYCSTCSNSFTINKNEHESSILHLFNSKYELPITFGIPESNKGFQLLLKTGWNKKTGLGPNGKGRMFPVKAKIKKDKTGIGTSNNSDNKQPLQKLKSQKKKADSFYKLKEKTMEINFRREFF